MAGVLYIVPTPIGNLGDLSPRAEETLRLADVVACEDTRHTQKLLNHFGIKVELVSYHEHNEQQRAAELIRKLESGLSVALVSDAGTPAISDPGVPLVRAAHEAGIKVISLPGPSALIAAAAASGLGTDSIFFGGFLPSRPGQRRKRLRECAEIPATLVFYESPHRIAASLADCLAVLGDRQASISRELSKIHEETLTGKISQLITIIDAKAKGEFVLVIDRGTSEAAIADKDTPDLKERVRALEAEGMTSREALKKAAKELGLARSEAYRLLHIDGE
ncbi:MAG: 16S rRNA (cytidine(1402)-2'-O)-methyltransferase [Acidobacteria bacterium]|nr:16S rRNA (cytidine(1402)-2'-O)-methyltransferase [Acidobacteriota bacterium]